MLVRPETGRPHQLRVHALEGLGFPLVGDPVYGRGGIKTRTLLHAERLVVKRDVKPSIIAEAPFPDSFIALGFRSEEHTSELPSLMRISYAVLCLKKKI